MSNKSASKKLFKVETCHVKSLKKDFSIFLDFTTEDKK